MHQYHATVIWSEGQIPVETGKYSREHKWIFDNNITIPASSSPLIVPLPYSNENAVDPEESLIASASSCHMLTFLYIAYTQEIYVNKYVDHAVGQMGKNNTGKDFIKNIFLNPEITFKNHIPTSEHLTRIHELAHEDCYIANTIKSEIIINSKSFLLK